MKSFVSFNETLIYMNIRINKKKKSSVIVMEEIVVDSFNIYLKNYLVKKI